MKARIVLIVACVSSCCLFAGCHGDSAPAVSIVSNWDDAVAADPNLSLEDVCTIVIALERSPEAVYYLLRGDAVAAFTNVIKKETEIEPSGVASRSTQTHGGEVWFHALTQDDSPKFEAFLTWQYVEGMGGKWDRDWDKGLMEGQRERYRLAWGIVEKNGERISQERFKGYVKASGKEPRRVVLYWKK